MQVNHPTRSDWWKALWILRKIYRVYPTKNPRVLRGIIEAGEAVKEQCK